MCAKAKKMVSFWDAQAWAICELLSKDPDGLNHPDHPLGEVLPSIVQRWSGDLPDLLTIDNSDLFYRLRSFLAGKRFAVPPGERWPAADLTTTSRKLRALAQLKPDPHEVEPFLSNPDLIEWQEKVAAYINSMDDLTADVLDVITAVWLKEAAHPEAMVTVTADDFLRYRGLRPQKSSTGRRGGYKKAWRREIANHINILHEIWITVFERQVTKVEKGKKKRTIWEGESRAVNISSRFGQRSIAGTLEAFAWRIRPGDVFSKFLLGPGRQTAILSQKALHYDPYRQRWEKRLTRYLAYLWRIRQSRRQYLAPFSVAALLKDIGLQVDSQHPYRTRERLEKALNRLQEDKVIASWQYGKIDEDQIGRKGWWRNWGARKVVIEPPPEVVEHYRTIKPRTSVRKKVVPLGPSKNGG